MDIFSLYPLLVCLHRPISSVNLLSNGGSGQLFRARKHKGRGLETENADLNQKHRSTFSVLGEKEAQILCFSILFTLLEL